MQNIYVGFYILYTNNRCRSDSQKLKTPPRRTQYQSQRNPKITEYDIPTGNLQLGKSKPKRPTQHWPSCFPSKTIRSYIRRVDCNKKRRKRNIDSTRINTSIRNHKRDTRLLHKQRKPRNKARTKTILQLLNSIFMISKKLLCIKTIA